MTESSHVLVTGGTGCIGTQTVKWLLANTRATVVVGSREVSRQQTRDLFEEDDCTRLKSLRIDIRNQRQLEEALTSHAITHVIHLAAMQTPDCNADRDLGLQVNLAGTQNLIEAIKACRPSLHRFVFASSIAVYGPRHSYPGLKVPMLAEPAPVNVY